MNCFNEPGLYPKNFKLKRWWEQDIHWKLALLVCRKDWSGKGLEAQTSTKKLHINMIWSSWGILVAWSETVPLEWQEVNGLQKHKVRRMVVSEYLEGMKLWKGRSQIYLWDDNAYNRKELWGGRWDEALVSRNLWLQDRDRSILLTKIWIANEVWELVRSPILCM